LPQVTNWTQVGSALHAVWIGPLQVLVEVATDPLTHVSHADPGVVGMPAQSVELHSVAHTPGLVHKHVSHVV
jgi:hypothetical protein